MQIQIKTHRMNTSYQQPHFFILNKGQNAGKPLGKPCPNCFVILIMDMDYKDQLFWLAYGLWRAAHFHPYLVGTVIPFLRREELSHILLQAQRLLETKKESTGRMVTAMKKLHALEERLSLQFHLVDQIRMSHVLNWLKS